MEDANRFLEHYLPVYNRRFALAPAPPADLHRPIPPAHEWEGSLCLKTTRCLRKDFTIVHQGQLYQIDDTIRATHVQVEQRLDGTVRLTHHGRALGFHAIAPGTGGQASAPLPPPRHAESQSSVAYKVAAGTRTTPDGSRNIKPDISILRESGHF